MPEDMADRTATAEVRTAEIGPSKTQRPTKPHASMRVTAFSSATWASDADFEAARDDQNTKVHVAN